MIRWRDPLLAAPKEGELIWYVTVHSKRLPASFEILPGYAKVWPDGSRIEICQEDERGGGSEFATWPGSETRLWDDQVVIAWVPYDEINVPSFLIKPSF